MSEELAIRVARIEELDKKRLQSIDSYLATSYPNAFGQQDTMEECNSDFLNAAPEMLSIIRELKAENEKLINDDMNNTYEARIVLENVILKAENDALKQALVILPDGAEAESGDLVSITYNDEERVGIFSKGFVFSAGDYVLMADEYDFKKIIQRHGLPVIYQSALQPKQEVK